MHVQTFAASSTARLDAKVNHFLARHDIVVRQLHPAMSFGTYMIVVEHDVAGPTTQPGVES